MKSDKRGKENAMNSINHKGRSSKNNNHLNKEGIMKGKTLIKGISRDRIYMTAAAAVLIIALALITQPLRAQPRGGFWQSPSPEVMVQTLTDRLDLTEEQVEAVWPIIEEKHNRMTAIREKAGANRRAFRQEMQTLRWDSDTKLNEILTDEQIDRHNEMQMEQRDRKGRGRFGGKKIWGGNCKTPEAAVERLSSTLDLTEEQELAIEPIIRESIEKRREVVDTYRTTGFPDRQVMRAEMWAIGDETHDELSAILTDEQMEKLDARKEARRARSGRWMNRPGPKGF